MTGYKSKRSAAQDKVTDIDGHVVRDVRKPRKLPQRPWVDHEPDGRMATQKFIEAENKKVSERYGYVPKLHPGEWQDNLAQPAQEPVAVVAVNQSGGIRMEYQDGSAFDISKHVGQRFYTASPQRTWVELEGEEIRNLWEEATKQDRSTVTIVTSFARAIEAKLKEKNSA